MPLPWRDTLKFYCGCCGNGPLAPTKQGVIEDWCARCMSHVGSDGQLWDRTYEAVHGTPCPYQVA